MELDAVSRVRAVFRVRAIVRLGLRLWINVLA